MHRLTGRRPVIYTTAHWWNLCTAGSTAFAAEHALWMFWQYDNGGELPGDQNLFNGSTARLKRFAEGSWD